MFITAEVNVGVFVVERTKFVMLQLSLTEFVARFIAIELLLHAGGQLSRYSPQKQCTEFVI